jgi:hypothetical protein
LEQASSWLIRVGCPQRNFFFAFITILTPLRWGFFLGVVLLFLAVVRWSRGRRNDIGLPPLALASGSSWPKSMRDGEAALAFLRILLGCFVGMRAV